MLKILKFVLLFCFVSSLCNCKDQTYTDKYLPCDMPNKTVYEYNPRKAGAKVLKRINVPAGYGMTYLNGHFYMLADNRLSIFDLSDNEILPVRDITFDSVDIQIEYKKIRLCGLLECDNQIIFMTSDFFKKGKNIFSINTLEHRLYYADISADIQHHLPDLCTNLEYFYYDGSSDSIDVCFSNIGDSETKKFFVYKCKDVHGMNHLETEELVESISNPHFYSMLNLSHHGCILGQYAGLPNRSIVNSLLIYKDYRNLPFHKIDLCYLLIDNRPLSAFSDDNGDIWLYVREPSQGSDGHLRRKLLGTDADVQQAQGRKACADAQVADDPCDKYELLKLKLL